MFKDNIYIEFGIPVLALLIGFGAGWLVKSYFSSSKDKEETK